MNTKIISLAFWVGTAGSFFPTLAQTAPMDTPTPVEWTPTATPTAISTAATPTATAVGTPEWEAPGVGNSVTVVPSPWGDKLTFRVMVSNNSDVKIRIYDHFYSPVTELEKKGSSWFDILWKLKEVPDGFYYYETEVDDLDTGLVSNLPPQKFVVNH